MAGQTAASRLLIARVHCLETRALGTHGVELVRRQEPGHDDHAISREIAHVAEHCRIDRHAPQVIDQPCRHCSHDLHAEPVQAAAVHELVA
jgi:hypothetical protein